MPFKQPYNPPKPYPAPGAALRSPAEQGPNEQSIVASGMTMEEWQRKHPVQPLGPAPEEVGQVTTDPPDGSPPETPFPGTGTSADPGGEKTAVFAENPVPIASSYPSSALAAQENAEKAALAATEAQAIADAAEDATGGVTPPNPETLTITSPTEGATVPPVHDVIGTGAVANGSVELWHVEANVQVDTAGADADGNWGFTGDTPASVGEVTWEVRDGVSSAQVHITVSDVPETMEVETAPWHDLNTHAALNAYLSDNGIEQPADWSSLTMAAKKTWLDQNVELVDEEGT